MCDTGSIVNVIDSPFWHSKRCLSECCCLKECLRDILPFGLESGVGFRFQSVWMFCSEWTMHCGSFCKPAVNSLPWVCSFNCRDFWILTEV